MTKNSTRIFVERSNLFNRRSAIDVFSASPPTDVLIPDAETRPRCSDRTITSRRNAQLKNSSHATVIHRLAGGGELAGVGGDLPPGPRSTLSVFVPPRFMFPGTLSSGGRRRFFLFWVCSDGRGGSTFLSFRGWMSTQ
ncbi:hypothetical protein EVAR_81150_1 [Eumeta japonica]|uniref:Uncharacterized protein n=1 Tax=Eumeta variegata TaxID=151549 RepID=A0A4C1UK28_EUMVA|nr:hypothetical protein EVAR_81150_1 [Eumeta japonica]